LLTLLRVEVLKLFHSRLLHASLALFLVYALVLMLGFREMLGPLTAGHESGSMYLYMAFVLAFYPFVAAVAIIFAGASLSQEVRAGTLRYTLLAPVARWQVIVGKLMSTCVAVLMVMLFLLLAVGSLSALLGEGNAMTYDLWAAGKPAGRAPTLLGADEILQRCLLALPLAVCSAVGNASLAFLFSTLVSSPLVAITVPLSLFFISSIIQFSPVLPKVKPYLPTRQMFFWDEAFGQPIAWGHIADGVIFYGTLLLVCACLSWLLFAARDVRS
jgi:ABC-2 type transport system permease protein